MKITKERLLEIIKEELNFVLGEGRQEKKWISQQPQEEQEQWSAAEQQGLKLSELAWIKKVRGDEPIQDIIGDVVEFKDQKTQQILKANDFEMNLSKKTYPTVNDLRRTLQKISDADGADAEYEDVLKDPSQVEFLGKVGNWEILMPLTQRGSVSCDISGRDTTWCTAKRKGQNLFYSYVGAKDKNVILFYVMDYSRTPDLQGKDPDSRLSIGFVDGEPFLKGKFGGLSVDAENNGLTVKSLQDYFGNNYSEIMSIIQEKAKQVGSSHPAKERIKKAAQNVILLKKMTKDYGRSEKVHFYKQILKQSEISPKVFSLLARDEERSIRKAVAGKRKVPPEVLAVLAKDEKIDVREAVARNWEAPSDVLESLYDSKNDSHLLNITSAIAGNWKVSPSLLLKITKDMMPRKIALSFGNSEYFVIENVISNIATPKEALEHILANDETGQFADEIQKHPNYKKELEESKMKITKERLLEIIKEELESILEAEEETEEESEEEKKVDQKRIDHDKRVRAPRNLKRKRSPRRRTIRRR